MLKCILSIFLFLSALSIVLAQSPDSLYKARNACKHDTCRLRVIEETGDYWENRSADSGLIWYKKGLDLCSKIVPDNNTANTVIRYKGNFLCDIGNHFIQKGDYSLGIEYQQKALLSYKRCNYSKGECNAWKSIGAVYFYQSDAVHAMEAFQAALRIAERTSDQEAISDCLNNMGMVNYYQDNNEKAIEYFNKSLDIRIKLGLKYKIGESYNNLGIVQSNDMKIEAALVYYKKALAVFEEIGELRFLSKLYNNIGVVYKDAGDNINARLYAEKALAAYISRGDKNGQALVLGNLADISLAEENYKDCIRYADSALSIALAIGSIQVQSNVYGYLTDVYEKTGNYRKSLAYYKLYKNSSDSLTNASKFNSISEMEAKYENEKKQLLIEKITREKALQNSEIKNKSLMIERQRGFIFIVIGGLVLFLIFSFLLFRQLKARKLANRLLKQQNAEIQQKNEEISSQRDEIEAQRDLVIQQRDEIEFIHREVTDSIQYARLIQMALLPNDLTKGSSIDDHFIIFMPRDIVSGDFYYTTQVGQYRVIAVADCTGHGVPGAFMSMLGIAFLNEIINKDEVNQANHVLNYLRNYVVKSLGQDIYTSGRNAMESGTVKDGMDIALIIIDEQNHTLQFAGANNSLYIVPVSHPGTVNEIRGDKMPIAIHVKMDSFINHEIKINHGDCIYLFTDGFCDQFGGAKNSKFMRSNLKKLLPSIAPLPMTEQKSILSNHFQGWKGSKDQTDDVTVMGIRIG